MKFETIKLKNTILPIRDIRKKSKDFYNIIKKRRTIREFKSQSFDDDIINNAILAAGTAPNGANLQPWHFVIIKDKNISSTIFKLCLTKCFTWIDFQISSYNILIGVIIPSNMNFPNFNYMIF